MALVFGRAAGATVSMAATRQVKNSRRSSSLSSSGTQELAQSLVASQLLTKVPLPYPAAAETKVNRPRPAGGQEFEQSGPHDQVRRHRGAVQLGANEGAALSPALHTPPGPVIHGRHGEAPGLPVRLGSL